MRNRNVFVLVLAVVLIALVAVMGIVFSNQQRTVSENAPALTVEPQITPATTPADVSSAEEPTASPSTNQPAATSQPADAYLLVTVRGMVYEPIPLKGEGSFTIRQKDLEAENVIHVTENSIRMESSSCDNQDCVLQGEVTLDNMTKRVLANMVICLPNEVTLELHTPETLTETLGQFQ